MRNKRLNDTVSKVKVYAEKMARMSDAQLQAETTKLK